MENVKKSCLKCYRDITEEEYKEYKGHCKSCYEVITCNLVAKIIKIIAIIVGVIGIFYGLTMLDSFSSEEFALPIIIASIVTAIFVYGFGEIIQLLEDIKNK